MIKYQEEVDEGGVPIGADVAELAPEPETLTKAELEVLAQPKVQVTLQEQVDKLLDEMDESDSDEEDHKGKEPDMSDLQLQTEPPKPSPMDIIKDALEEINCGASASVSTQDGAGLDANFEKPYEIWKREFLLCAEAGRLAVEQKQLKIPPVSQHCSLMIYLEGGARHANFIHWIGGKQAGKGKKGLCGRQVACKDGKLIFSVASLYPTIVFRSPSTKTLPHEAILADIGIAMQKVREHERPVVSKLALRLKDMCNVVLTLRSGPGSPGDAGAQASSSSASSSSSGSLGSSACLKLLAATAGGSPCFICDGMTPPLKTCPLCMTTSHVACSGPLADWAFKTGVLALLPIGAAPHREFFDCERCLVCERSGLLSFGSD